MAEKHRSGGIVIYRRWFRHWRTKQIVYPKKGKVFRFVIYPKR